MESAAPHPAVTTPEARAVMQRHVLLQLGRFTTRATLLAATEGETRFICAATAPADAPDRGVPMALDLLAVQTGTPRPAIDGLILARRPLRLLTVGPPDAATTTALDTITALGVVQITARNDTPPRGAGREAGWARQMAAATQHVDALLVLVPSGVLPGWVARLFNVLNALPWEKRPPCIVVHDADTLRDLVPPGTPIVIPGADPAVQLADALGQIAARLLVAEGLPDAGEFREQALATALVAAHRVTGKTLLYLDLSDGCTLILVAGGQARVVRDAETDAGAGAATLLARVGEERIARWLPFPFEQAAARQWAARRAAWPAALPLTAQDRAITGAFAREALRALVARVGMAAEACDLCILGPGMTEWGTPGQLLLAVADTVPFAGPVALTGDPDDLLPAIGWLTRARPESAAALFARDTLENLGTLLPVFGTGAEGETAVQVALDETDEAQAVPWGSVRRVPLGDTTATLATSAADGRSHTQVVQGGRGGILVDARGRPLRAAPERAEQQERVHRWLNAVERGDR